MTRIEELAREILVEMEKIGAKKPKVEIYSYGAPDGRSACKIAQKAIGVKPDNNQIEWVEAQKGRIFVVAFIKEE